MTDALVALAFGLLCLALAAVFWVKWDNIVEEKWLQARRYEGTPLAFLAWMSMKPGRWGSGSWARATCAASLVAFGVMFFAFAVASVIE